MELTLIKKVIRSFLLLRILHFIKPKKILQKKKLIYLLQNQKFLFFFIKYS